MSLFWWACTRQSATSPNGERPVIEPGCEMTVAWTKVVTVGMEGSGLLPDVLWSEAEHACSGSRYVHIHTYMKAESRLITKCHNDALKSERK